MELKRRARVIEMYDTKGNQIHTIKSTNKVMNSLEVGDELEFIISIPLGKDEGSREGMRFGKRFYATGMYVRNVTKGVEDGGTESTVSRMFSRIVLDEISLDFEKFEK